MIRPVVRFAAANPRGITPAAEARMSVFLYTAGICARLYALGAARVKLWGPQRAQAALPVHTWREEGAHLSAGSDYPAAGCDPMRSILGLVTRDTAGAGVLGSDEAIDQYTALWLYTAAGATLDRGRDRRGVLLPGRLADLVAFRADPVTCPPDELLSLRPAFTMVGGRATYDPDGMLGDV